MVIAEIEIQYSEYVGNYFIICSGLVSFLYCYDVFWMPLHKEEENRNPDQEKGTNKKYNYFVG